MCAGFPRLGVLRRLRPVPDRSAVDAPSPTIHVGHAVTGRTGTVPVFTVIRSTKEEPDSVPAASPRLPRSTSPWSPGQSLNTGPGVPRPSGRVRAAPGPYPPGLGPVRTLRNVYAGSLRTPFHPARRTRAIWQCWHVPALSGPLATLPVVTRIGLPPAPPPCCDRAGGEGLSPPLEYTAPHGALNGGRILTPSRHAAQGSGFTCRRQDRRALLLEQVDCSLVKLDGAARFSIRERRRRVMALSAPISSRAGA